MVHIHNYKCVPSDFHMNATAVWYVHQVPVWINNNRRSHILRAGACILKLD